MNSIFLCFFAFLFASSSLGWLLIPPQMLQFSRLHQQVAHTHRYKHNTYLISIAAARTCASIILPSSSPFSSRVPRSVSSIRPSTEPIRHIHTFQIMSAHASSTPSSSTPSCGPTPPSLPTRVWKVDPRCPAAELEASLAEAAQLLREGQLVAFPTETVYGLGGNALSSSALQGIYIAKGRPSDNPLIVHVHSHEQFLSLGSNIPKLTLKLAESFWPGPLTLIIPTATGPSAACEVARAGLKCVGVRMPSHPVALALLRACGVPLAAPSANLSGRPSPTTAQHVFTDLNGRVAGIIDGGSASDSFSSSSSDSTQGASNGVGVESTVVECEDGVDGSPGIVTILRPGGVTREQLERVAGKGNVRIDPAIELKLQIQTQPIQPLPKQEGARVAETASIASLSSSPSPAPATITNAASSATSSSPSSPSPSAVGPKAPGMKYTHYAPRAPLVLVDGPTQFLLDSALPYVERGEVVGILATNETSAQIDSWKKQHSVNEAQVVFVRCGSANDLASVARDLYATLRAFDDTPVQIIFSQLFTTDGMGDAIMNRLNKAAGGKTIRSTQ